MKNLSTNVAVVVSYVKYICKVQLSTRYDECKICRDKQHFATFLSIRGQKRSGLGTDMGKRLIMGTELERSSHQGALGAKYLLTIIDICQKILRAKWKLFDFS